MIDTLNYTMLETNILEGSGATVTGTLLDDNDDPLILSAGSVNSLSGMSLTLYSFSDSETFTIINNRDAQDVLNQNNVTIDVLGNFTWYIQPGDTKIVDNTNREEIHRAVFTWTYGNYTLYRVGKKIIDFRVYNLDKIVT